MGRMDLCGLARGAEGMRGFWDTGPEGLVPTTQPPWALAPQPEAPEPKPNQPTRTRTPNPAPTDTLKPNPS